jgi:hypothetical protein
VVVLNNGLPVRALAPGSHRVWGTRLTEQRWCTDNLLLDTLPELRDTLPRDWFASVTLTSRQRGVLWRDARPVAFLRPGTHRYWTVDPSVNLTIYSVDQPVPELSEELLRVLPSSELVRRLVETHERGLLYVKGALQQLLMPGQYAVWSHPEAPARIMTVDVRSQQTALAAQELMTRDKVTLRLSLTAEYAVQDPVLAMNAATDLRDSVYLLVQLAARDYVASVMLDQLLEGRDEMTRYLEAQVAPRALNIGVRIDRIGVKDVVLPGEMKTLLNRVIEAEKQAAANVILRREEAAATRLLSNTARVMAEHPVLMRMKELETLKEVATRVNELRLVVGSDGLQKLLPAQLLRD